MNVRDFDIGVIRPFDVNSDPSSVGSEWKRWLQSFQLLAVPRLRGRLGRVRCRKACYGFVF